MAKVIIYTDGSQWPPNGPGGWAAILMCKELDMYKEISGGEELTTIGKMELMAVIEALKALRGGPHNVEIHIDAQYVVTMINGGRAKKNKEHVATLRVLCKRHYVKAIWVRGHNGNQWNERCDYLAGEQRAKYSLIGKKAS